MSDIEKLIEYLDEIQPTAGSALAWDMLEKVRNRALAIAKAHGEIK